MDDVRGGVSKTRGEVQFDDRGQMDMDLEPVRGAFLEELMQRGRRRV